MLQFCAVIGRICLDIDFDKEVFTAAKPKAPFEDLKDLRMLLRQTNGLDLSREDVLEINRILTESFPGDTSSPVRAYDQDALVNIVREGLPPQSFPFLGHPENVMFCAAFGLACVDRLFRLLIDNAIVPEDLRTELAKPTDIHPKIDLTLDQTVQFLELVKQRENRLAAFHQGKWIVPERIACSAGYSPDAAMLYASQTAVISYLFRHPDALGPLAEGGVVQGNLNMLRQVFEEGVEEARLRPLPPIFG